MPSAALVKAALVHGARPMRGIAHDGGPLEYPPGFEQGWGALDLRSSMPVGRERDRKELFVSDMRGVGEGDAIAWCLEVVAGSNPPAEIYGPPASKGANAPEPVAFFSPGAESRSADASTTESIQTNAAASDADPITVQTGSTGDGSMGGAETTADGSKDAGQTSRITSWIKSKTEEAYGRASKTEKKENKGDESEDVVATLAWTDPPGRGGSDLALVNDLDLEIVPPGAAGSREGWSQAMQEFGFGCVWCGGGLSRWLV